MAWYLNYSFFDAGKYITASIPASTTNVSLPLRIEWEIEFEARKNGTEFIIASTAFNTTSTLLFIRSGTDFELRSPGNSNWLVTTGVTLTNFNVFKIRSTFNGTTATQTLHINGSLVATRTPTTAAIGDIAAFFGLNSNSNRHGDFKYFKYTDFVTPANNRLYDANASGGTGTVLPETIGGFNGNQSGTWPADNSEWVFYSSGASNQSTISYDIGAVNYAISSTVSAPSATSTISYDIGAVNFASTASVGVRSTAAYDIGQVDFSVNSLLSARAAAAFDIGSIDFSSVASVGNSAAANYDIGEIEYLIDALNREDAQAVVSFDIGDIEYLVSANFMMAEPERSLSTKNVIFWGNSPYFNPSRRI